MCHYSPAAALTKALAICIEFELFLCPLAATVRKEANERERLEERVREREMSKKKEERGHSVQFGSDPKGSISKPLKGEKGICTITETNTGG